MRKKLTVAAVAGMMFMVLMGCARAVAGQEGQLDVNVRNVYNLDGNPAVMDSPYAVDISESGDVYVADAANNRIIKFPGGDMTSPKFYPQMKAVAEVQNASVGVSIAATGTVDPKILAYARVDTDLRLFRPVGVAVDKYFIYIADSGNGRVVALKNNPDQMMQFSHAIGYFKNIGLIKDIATDGAGNLFLLDGRNGRVLKYDYIGRKLDFASGTSEIGGLLTPYGLTLDKAGNIYVADTTHHKVLKYGPDGTLLMSFGEKGKADGKMFYPQDVAVDDKGNIFVADTENNRIEKFLADGTYAGYFGGWGREKGQFFHNRKLAFGMKDGRLLLYAVDTSLWRVTVMEIEPNLVIVHTPYRYITANPVLVAATIQTKMTEPSGLKMVYRLDAGATQSFQITEILHNSFKGNATISGLKTGQKFIYRLEADTVDSHAKNTTDYYMAEVDLDPPVIQNTKPADGVYVSGGTLDVSADYYDVGTGVASETVKMYIDGVAVATQSLVITQGHIQYSAAVSGLAEGRREIKVVVGDNAGNVSTKTIGVVVDRTPPVVGISSFKALDYPTTEYAGTMRPIAAKRLAVTGDANDANMDYFTVKVKCGGSTAWTELDRNGTAGNISGGTLGVWDSAQFSDGVCDLMAEAVDKAGNVGDSAVYQAEADNTPPGAVVLEPFFGSVLLPQQLSLAGGTTELKAAVSEQHLKWYKFESLESTPPPGCTGGSGWMTAAQNTYTPYMDASGNSRIEIKNIWTINDPPAEGATRIYTLRLTVGDAYMTTSYCSLFNIGLTGIVITPLPAKDMPGNLIRYDLSDGGMISISIVRAIDYKVPTSLKDLNDGTMVVPVKDLFNGWRQPKGVSEAIWDGKDNSGVVMPDTSDYISYYYIIAAKNDAGYTTHEFGKIAKATPPYISLLGYNAGDRNLYFEVNKEISTLDLSVNNMLGTTVANFNRSAAILYSVSNGKFLYIVPWNMTNMYGQQVETGRYFIKISAGDGSGNYARHEVYADFGAAPPVITPNVVTLRKTDEIIDPLVSGGALVSWPSGTRIMIGKSWAVLQTVAAELRAATVSPNGAGVVTPLKTGKMLEVLTVSSGVANGNYVEWNGRVYDPQNGTVFTDEPCNNPYCEFFAYDTTNKLIGYNAQMIKPDGTPPAYTFTKTSTSGDISFTATVNTPADILKSYMLSVYDLEGNLVKRYTYQPGETWSATKSQPNYAWKQHLKTINFSSAGELPPLRTPGVRIKLQGEDDAGNVGSGEFEIKQPVPFTADTGAVVVSDDGNAMLRVPPYSVTDTAFQYSNLNIQQVTPQSSTTYNSTSLPSGVAFLGKIYDFGPSGTTFKADKPAILRLYYSVVSGRVVIDGINTNADESTLALYYYDYSKGVFERWAGGIGIENYGTAQERHYLWVPLSHLSTYFLAYDRDSLPPLAAITGTKPNIPKLPASGGIYDIFGTAIDDNTNNNPIRYTLEYGRGIDTINVTYWTTIATSSVSMPAGSVIGSWNATNFNGDYILRLTVEDTAGNTTYATKAFSFVSTGVDPVTDVKAPGISGIGITRQYFSPVITSTKYKPMQVSYALDEDASATLRVIDAAGRVVKTLYKNNGLTAGSTSATYYGDTDNAPPAIAADGIARFEITAYDAAKNKTVALSPLFTIDSTPPTVTPISPKQGELAMSANPSISFLVSDTTSGVLLSSIKITLNGKTMSKYDAKDVSPGVYTVSFTPTSDVNDGPNEVSVNIRDNAKNLTAMTWAFNGDAISPIVQMNPIQYSPFSPVESIGRKDECLFSADVTEKTGFTWQLDIVDASGTVVFSKAGSGAATESGGPLPVSAAWDGSHTWINGYGEIEGAYSPDGQYAYNLIVTDGAGNKPTVIKGHVVKDDAPPIIENFSRSNTFFSPFTSSPVKIVNFTAEVTESNFEKAYWSLRDMAQGGKEIAEYPITFNGNSMASYTVIFDWDGMLPGNPQTRAADGYYGVVLFVYDKAGNVSMNTGTATVVLDNKPPVANPGPEAVIGEGSVYTLDATKSTDETSGIKLYAWDLDNNGTYETLGATASVSYPDDATVTVGLRVEDFAGLVGTASLMIVVKNVVPSVDAGPDINVRHGQPALLSGAFSDPGINDALLFAWDFGDGSPVSTTESTEHYYPIPGVYEATFKAKDKDGGVGTDTTIVTVYGDIIVTDAYIIPSVPAQYEEPYMSYRISNMTGTILNDGVVMGIISSPAAPGIALAQFSQQIGEMADGEQRQYYSKFSPINADPGEYDLMLYYQAGAGEPQEIVLKTKVLVQGCVK